MSNDRMILRNENSIYMFYEIVEQLEPASILDMGMFLKRAGSVSRKIMDREVPKEVVLDGVDFFPEVSFPIWNTIYNGIETAEEYFGRMDSKRYDLATVFGIEELKKKIPLADIAERAAKASKYVLVDQWLLEWSGQKGFIRAVDIKVEEDIYFLMEFGA